MRPGPGRKKNWPGPLPNLKETLPARPESRKKPKSRRALPQKRCPPPWKTRSRPLPRKRMPKPVPRAPMPRPCPKAPPPHPCRQGAMKPKAKPKKPKRKTNYPGCALFRVPRRPRPGLRGQPQAHPARGRKKPRARAANPAVADSGPRRRARLLLQRPCPRMALPCSHLWKDATARARKSVSRADAR